MECIAARLSHASPTLIFRRAKPHEPLKSNRNRRLTFKTKVNDDDDPCLRAAINAASLRFHETNRPDNVVIFCKAEPLLHDPYAGCFVHAGIEEDPTQCPIRYLLSTKFIDDKLLEIANQIDDPKQVVLLTDGMDSRPYRLSWPTPTIIFDVSPHSIFDSAASKLQGVGAKVRKGCVLRHVPLSDCSSVEERLRAKGFNGARPSVWVIQGLPVSLSSFEEMLVLITTLAAKGCFFLGELPASFGSKNSTRQWMEKLFLSNGFGVNLISHDQVANSLGKSLPPGNYANLLFVAQHLRFSDDQMEIWRREFERVEEEADEDGFDEL